MISKYFKDFDKRIVRKKKQAAGTDKKKSGSRASKATIDIKTLKATIAGIIPSTLKVDSVKAIDSSGFSPDGVDLLVYREYCPDIINIMGGYVPFETIYGMYHIVQELTKDSLVEVFNKIATAKKLNVFAVAQEDTERTYIPSFIVAAHTKYNFQELKNDIVNYYLSKNIEHQNEIDILMVLNRGIVVKNWREKRSFIAIETNDDTNMWFFILMNEYLEVNRQIAIDFRKYVKKDVVYSEF